MARPGFTVDAHGDVHFVRDMDNPLPLEITKGKFFPLKGLAQPSRSFLDQLLEDENLSHDTCAIIRLLLCAAFKAGHS